MPDANPEAVGGLVAALRALVTTDPERAEARTGVLAAMPSANPEAVGGLVAALRSLSPVRPWLAWLATNE